MELVPMGDDVEVKGVLADVAVFLGHEAEFEKKLGLTPLGEGMLRLRLLTNVLDVCFWVWLRAFYY